MAEFSRNFHRPSAGSHTVEGNVSGTRAMRLEQQRQQDQEAFELAEAKKRQDASQASLNIHAKFQTARMGSAQEQAFRAKTVGLVTAQAFQSATLEKEQSATDEAKKKLQEEARLQIELLEKKESKKRQKKKRKERKKMASLLSFMNDGEENEDEEEGDDEKVVSSKKAKKDPTVDTSFLPDQEREKAQEQERIRLEQEWKERQLAAQKQPLEITYSYWDGSGHRRTLQVLQGSTVGDFLELVRVSLCGEFKELSRVASDALLYVKEDLILPHDITFYDLIATKARGKSGPLFHFDVHEDVRLGPLDMRVEKDESHPGKVVERQWYERNKHIFPASRWELYDPSKTYEDTYTIGGKIVTHKNKK